jgi:hypothetical protein
MNTTNYTVPNEESLNKLIGGGEGNLHKLAKHKLVNFLNNGGILNFKTTYSQLERIYFTQNNILYSKIIEHKYPIWKHFILNNQTHFIDTEVYYKPQNHSSYSRFDIAILNKRTNQIDFGIEIFSTNPAKIETRTNVEWVEFDALEISDEFQIVINKAIYLTNIRKF